MIGTDKSNSQNEGVPLGFGMALAMQPGGMEAFAALTETQKQAYLERARNAKSKREMGVIVQELTGSGTYSG